MVNLNYLLANHEILPACNNCGNILCRNKQGVSFKCYFQELKDYDYYFVLFIEIKSRNKIIRNGKSGKNNHFHDL